MAIIQKIEACLWFDKQAENAVNFYLSVFNNSGIIRILRYGKEGFDDPDAGKAERVIKEIFRMKKLDIATLRMAYLDINRN